MIENPQMNQARYAVMNAVMNATCVLFFFLWSTAKNRQNLRADMYTTETGIAQTSSLRFHAIDLMKMKITVVSKIYEKNNPK